MHGGVGERAVTRLPADASAVPTARRFASQALVHLGASERMLDTTKLLVTELATNAVLHARSPIRVSVEGKDHAVRVEVRDDDPGPLAPPARPEADATSGRGLWLVACLASTWGVNSNERGKTIWFEVDEAVDPL
jgi:anti-sigma regulatory factor (Ser/Thr protein kinase)